MGKILTVSLIYAMSSDSAMFTSDSFYLNLILIILILLLYQIPPVEECLRLLYSHLSSMYLVYHYPIEM